MASLRGMKKNRCHRVCAIRSRNMDGRSLRFWSKSVAGDEFIWCGWKRVHGSSGANSSLSPNEVSGNINRQRIELAAKAFAGTPPGNRNSHVHGVGERFNVQTKRFANRAFR
jgi:hypothetical protein